jgi:tryptophan synthase alpha chain
MAGIKEAIEKANSENRLALSIYITSGFPDKDNFVDVVLRVFEAGADMIEIGVPFSDPLADGPVIQKSSFEALQNGVTPALTLEYVRKIREKTDKPLILMGYLNPIINYGIDKFIKDSIEAGVNGLIIPDLPLEEHKKMIDERFKGLDVSLLTTPTSTESRIKEIDNYSEGFVYCVSVMGTTGVRNKFDESVLNNINRTYKTVVRNKMMIGFGISKGEDVKRFAPYCDGVIVGSAVIKLLSSDYENKNEFRSTSQLVRELSEACQRD